MVEWFLGFGGFVLLLTVLPLLVVIGLPVWLYHKRKVMELRGSHAKDVQRLQSQIEVLDRRCAKMEEQIRTAHELIASEERELDRKLSTLLHSGDGAPSAPENGSPSLRRPERVRTRE